MKRLKSLSRAARLNGGQGWPIVGVTVVVAAAVVLCVCGHANPSSTGAFSWGGIAYSFPKTTLVREAIYSDAVVVKTDAYTFQVTRLRLFLDGSCFGAVRHGDTVLVKQTGAVLVNGVQRKIE